MTRQLGICFVAFSFILLTLYASTAQALTFQAIQDIKNFKSWYNKNDNTTACSTSASGESLVGADAEAQVFNYFTAPGRLSATQTAGMMGNMVAESGIQPQRLQGTASGVATPAERVGNTKAGWGLVQFTPASKFISTVTPISKANEVLTQVEFIWTQLQGQGPIPEKQAGDDLRATTTIEDAVRAFQGDSKIGGKYNGYERPADEAGSLPDRIAAAKVILSRQTSNSSGTNSCGTGTPASSGTIAAAIKLAIDYSWPDHHSGTYLQMKPNYAAAVAAAKTNGEYIGGINYPGIDCGGFVTRVMRNSGADPNYNWGPKNAQQGPTSAQEAYMKANPTKYKSLGAQSSTSGLQPGDIAINSVHTYMYVGNQSGFHGNSAASSLDERAPMADTAYFVQNGEAFQWYRLIQ